MRVLGLQLNNFRGIRKATLRLARRMLLVGDNNVGKTTILEALDLVLGPERLRDPDVITEHDFYGSVYLPKPGGVDSNSHPLPSTHSTDGDQHDRPQPDPSAYPSIEIRVLLGNLSQEEASRFVGHIRPLAEEDREILGDDARIGTDTQKILPVAFHATYEPDEDEFSAHTFFTWPKPENERDYAEYSPLSRSHKRAIGYLYLRSLRTATRAASLQRNSLLDILLRLNEVRPRIWRQLLGDLQNVGIDLDHHPELQEVLAALRRRLGNYLPSLGGKLSHSQLHVGRLTRESLRSQVSYFLETGAPDGHSLPFDLFGTGTANLLVLALLRTIAEAKQNVIFAMEEPEVALPPHTQRAIVKDVFAAPGQAIFTSHSPYVAERFLDEDIAVLRKSDGEATQGYLRDALQAQKAIKPKKLRSDFRMKYAEGLLARSVLVVEGISEYLAFEEVDMKMSEAENTAYLSTDLSGVVRVIAEGSETPHVAKVFGGLGVPAFPVWDTDILQQSDEQEAAAGVTPLPHSYRGLEALVAEEAPILELSSYLRSSADLARYQLKTPDDNAADAEWRSLAVRFWKKRKGEGDVAAFLRTLTVDQQPRSMVACLLEVFFQVTGGKLPPSDPLAGFLPSERRSARLAETSTPSSTEQ